MSLLVTCPDGHRVAIAADKLGKQIACPCCLAFFLAEFERSTAQHARKEEKKVRRSRDDDDDEDEEEEDEAPKKKKPATKPRPKGDAAKLKDAKSEGKKKPARKDDDDEDEDESEEDENEQEEEAEIDWTPRKRQLNLCSVGLAITVGAFGVMTLFTVVVCFWLIWCTQGVIGGFQESMAAEKVQDKRLMPAYRETATYFVAPAFALTQIILVIALFFNLTVPAKAEARSLALSGLVFALLFFVFGTLVLLAHYQVIVDDPIRAGNMVQMMGGAAGLCFLFSLMSTMAFQAKLMMFMNMKLEASQAVTNTGFYFLFLAGMFVLLFVSLYVCNYLHYYVGYGIVLAIFAMAGMAGRTLWAQIALMLKVRNTIAKYIREAA